jgi:hypothetical protein
MNFKALALSALVATTAIIGGASAEAYSFRSTVRSDYNGGYNINHSGGGRSTVRPDYMGGYSVNHSGGGRTTVRPSFGGGYNINSYGW